MADEITTTQSTHPDADGNPATHGLGAPESLSSAERSGPILPGGVIVPLTGRTPERHNQVDLGREDELVPWAEWFGRTAHVMEHVLDPENKGKRVFRVTLRDGRAFAVFTVQTHISRGKCSIRENRWGEKDAICDVITGYTLVGTSSDGRPVVLAVPPTEIASVECVIIGTQETGQETQEEEKEPFGFARWVSQREEPTLEELEDPAGSLGAAAKKKS